MALSRAAGALFAGALVVSGCDAPLDPGAERTPPAASRAAGETPPPLRTMDDVWAALADREIPGFAGHALDGQGNSVVYVAQAASGHAATEYVQRYRQRRGLGQGSVRHVPVAYDFRQLKTWADALVPALELPGMVLIDIDERQNRVVLGVRSAAEIGAGRREASSRGVPAAALEVRVVEAPEPRTDLYSVFRPVEGGVATINSAKGRCTIGFTAIYLGGWYDPQNVPGFVTASHCSSQSFGLDNSTQYQPDIRASQYSIGTEHVDYPKSSCNWMNICFPRSSDASFFKNNVGLVSDVGYIARPGLPVGIGGRGSLTIDPSNPRFEITLTAWQEETVVGLWLNKVGSTSGWTRGQVTQTCVTLSGLTCQFVSSIWSEPGDSGSPIFEDGANSSSPSGSEVKLHGILWGGPPNNWYVTWFSHIWNVSWDLGSLCVTSGC